MAEHFGSVPSFLLAISRNHDGGRASSPLSSPVIQSDVNGICVFLLSTGLPRLRRNPFNRRAWRASWMRRIRSKKLEK